MIDGEQKGPMNLEDLAEAGVRPDTYVWCKSLPDWMKASDVPDICRYFRLRLSNSLPLSTQPPAKEQMDMVSDFDSSRIKYRREELPKYPSSLPWLLFAISILLIIIGFLIL